MKNLLEIYCFTDNLVKLIDEKDKTCMVGRPGILSKSCYLTLSIFKNMYGFSTNTQLYEFTKEHLKSDFPHLPSYQQFNDGMTRYWRYKAIVLYCMTRSVKALSSDIHFIDSTQLPV